MATEVTWVQASEQLPPGVLRAWHAMQGNLALCGVMECVNPQENSGPAYMLAYQMYGYPKGIVQRFSDLEPCMAKARDVLSTVKLVPRAKLC